MLCQVCHRADRALLCRRCRVHLVPGTDRILDGGLRLISAFEHSGPAKILIHHLKYRGVRGYPELVAEVLAPRLPALPLVPVPRALSRRIKYGVDPSRLVAEAVARRLGVPVVPMLSGSFHTPRRAGGDHSRPVSPFRKGRAWQGPVMVIDDVVTSGGTILAAVESIGRDQVGLAVCANVVTGVSTLGTSPPPRG